MRAHLLFEQSGTFKRAFKNKGIEAFDYDIDNQFDETDFQINLFNEIEKAAQQKSSIFDDIKPNDLVLAFFPCTYFSIQNNLIFNRTAKHLKALTDDAIDLIVAERERERELTI